MGKPSDASASKSKESVPIFIDELHEGTDGLLTVLVCRKWDVLSINKKYMSTDYIMSDKKGSVIHCYAKSFIAHRFQKILEEGCLYSIKGFAVVPNSEKYRILKDADYMIELQATVVRKATDEIEKFNRYPFQLASFEQLTPTDNKHFVDVIGYVTIVGAPSTKSTGKKTVEFNLTNERGYQLRVTLWEDLGDEMVKRKNKHPGPYTILLTGMIAKEYLGNLCLSSSSATLLVDNDEIPAKSYTFKDAISVVDVIDTGLPVLQVRPTLDTLKQLLEWGREKRKRKIADFRSTVMITNIRTKNSWFNYTCTLGKCRKGVTPNQKGSFWCESCSTEVSYPRPRFRIQADVTDGTADVVVVLFDETVEKLVGRSTQSLLADAEQDDSGDTYVMPPVLQQLIGTSHIFEIKSHTYYQVADYESFNCSQVVVPELSEPEVNKEDKKSASFGNESLGSSLAISDVTENPLEIQEGGMVQRKAQLKKQHQSTVFTSKK